MASTVRLLWSLARWAWRGLTFAGQAVRGLARVAAQLAGPASSGDLLSRHATTEQWPPGLEDDVRRLANIFRNSFCGHCAAGPDYPQARCPKCRDKLAAMLTAEGGAA